MTAALTFLDVLRAAAQEADAAEVAFRREVASRIAALEQERAFAYRRINLMQAIAEAVGEVEDAPRAAAVAQAVLRARLGWTSDGDVRCAVLAEFAAIGQAVFDSLTPPEDGPAADVPAALSAFERWYADHHTTSFWVLFEHYVPETPLVDF